MSTGGTASNTSREIEVMNGSTISRESGPRSGRRCRRAGPANKDDSTGIVAEQRDQARLHVLLQERREYEQAPDAVDDAGNAGEQLDRDPDRPAQLHRTQLGQEHRDHEPDRNRDDIAMNEVTTVP